MIWTPGSFEHHHRAYGDIDMRVVFLPDNLAAQLPDRPAVFAASGLVREAMLALTRDTHARRSRVARERLQAVVIDELVPASEEPLHLPEPRDARLRALHGILHRDPANNATLGELGTRVGASQRTLARLFHDEFGMSFRQWRTQLRLHHALTLLAAGHTVTNTATACGWANPTSFIEAFSAALGETPARYRHVPDTRAIVSPAPGARVPTSAAHAAHDEALSRNHGHDIHLVDRRPDTDLAALLRWTASPATR